MYRESVRGKALKLDLLLCGSLSGLSDFIGSLLWGEYPFMGGIWEGDFGLNSPTQKESPAVSAVIPHVLLTFTSYLGRAIWGTALTANLSLPLSLQWLKNQQNTTLEYWTECAIILEGNEAHAFQTQKRHQFWWMYLVLQSGHSFVSFTKYCGF